MARSILPVRAIDRAILLVRGHRVLLDEDLARLYGVPTKRLNEAVKRNRQRFPADFMFRLNAKEVTGLLGLRSQSATSNPRGGRRYRPLVYTEQGVAMLSSVVNSAQAISVNIEIMRAFVRLRQALSANGGLAGRLKLVEAELARHQAESGKHRGESERHFRMVFDAIQRLLADADDEAPPARIGFALSRVTARPTR
jgi:hypothetical protein